MFLLVCRYIIGDIPDLLQPKQWLYSITHEVLNILRHCSQIAVTVEGRWEPAKDNHFLTICIISRGTYLVGVLDGLAAKEEKQSKYDPTVNIELLHMYVRITYICTIHVHILSYSVPLWLTTGGPEACA